MKISLILRAFFVVDFKIRLGDILLRHIDADLSSTNVLRVSLVSLDTSTASGRRHDAGDTESSLPTWVIDPSDVNQAVIDGCEWVHDHAAAGVFSIVDHHEGSADALLAEWLIIDLELVSVLDEAAAQSLQIGAE